MQTFNSLLFVLSGLIYVRSPPTDTILEGNQFSFIKFHHSKDLTDSTVQNAIQNAWYDMRENPLSDHQKNNFLTDLHPVALDSAIVSTELESMEDKIELALTLLCLWNIWNKVGMINDMNNHGLAILNFIHQTSCLMATEYIDMEVCTPIDELESMVYYFCEYGQSLQGTSLLQDQIQILSSILTNLVNCLFAKNYDRKKLDYTLYTMKMLGVRYMVPPSTTEYIDKITTNRSMYTVRYNELEHLRLLYRYGVTPFQTSPTDGTGGRPEIPTVTVKRMEDYLNDMDSVKHLDLWKAIVIHFLLMNGLRLEYLRRYVEAAKSRDREPLQYLYDDITSHFIDLEAGN